MADESPDFLMGFLSTLFAGLSTCLGMAFIPLLNTNIVSEAKSMAAAMAFSAGVMLWLGFMGILGGEALELFNAHYIADPGHVENSEKVQVRSFIALFFFLGMGVTVFMEQMVDRCLGEGHGHGHGHGHGDHGQGHGDHAHGEELVDVKDAGLAESQSTQQANDRLFKVSLVAILALAIHSFPEGLLTFFTASDGNFLVALGIALHHIPGGAAIAVATYKSTQSYMKALQGTAVAGVALPLGALVGWLLVFVAGVEDITDFIYGAMYAASGGTLVALALSGMLPEAFAQSSSTFCLLWVSLGFLLMEASIIIILATGGHTHDH